MTRNGIRNVVVLLLCGGLAISNLDSLRRALADVWSPRSMTRTSDVIEQNYRLSAITEADPGPYDLRGNPYWRGPIDACSDPDTRIVTILKSTQVGGTITSQGILLARAATDPAPAMIVFPTRDEAQKQRDRIYLNAEASSPLFARMVPPRRQWGMTAIELGAMSANLAWSGSAQRLRGKPCRDVYLSETDVYDVPTDDRGDPHRAAAERTKQFYNSLIFEESTPVGDDSYIFSRWEKSLKHRWYCPCPHCGAWQELRFFPNRTGKHAGCGGIVGYTVDGTPNGDLLDAETARIRAHYVCINGCRIEQNFKNAMVSAGKWVADGQKIDKRGRVRGKPSRDRRHVGYHIWTIHQNKLSIGDIAAAFVDRKADGDLRTFFQDWLGLRYRRQTKLPSWEVVARRFASPYQIGVVPDDVWFLTVGVDVQRTHILFAVVGWAPMRTPYLIDFGEIHQSEETLIGLDDGSTDEDSATGVTGSDLARVPTFLDATYRVDGTTPTGRQSLRPRLVVVDSGYRQRQVYDVVADANEPNKLRAVRGDDSVTAQQRFRAGDADIDAATGKPMKAGLKVWRIFKMGYQEMMEQRLGGAPDQPGSLHLPQNILPAGRKLLRQMLNVRKNKRGVYVPVSHSVGEDYRDCICYAEAAADMVVGAIGWTRAAWDEWKQSTQRKTTKRRTRADILER